MFVRDIEECEAFIAGDGTILREVIHPGHVNIMLRYSLAHAMLKPGEESVPHRLKASEVYYILEGRGDMYVEGEWAAVTVGHAVYVPPDAVQYIRNSGSTDLKFLCIVDPAWRADDEEVC